jgi:hypothetical protein
MQYTINVNKLAKSHVQGSVTIYYFRTEELCSLGGIVVKVSSMDCFNSLEFWDKLIPHYKTPFHSI